jgi:hypothetical protein
MRGAGEVGHARPGGGTLNKHGERSSPGAHAKEGPAAAPWLWWPCLWPDGPDRAGYWARLGWVGADLGRAFGSAQLDRIGFFFRIYFQCEK